MKQTTDSPPMDPPTYHAPLDPVWPTLTPVAFLGSNALAALVSVMFGRLFGLLVFALGVAGTAVIVRLAPRRARVADRPTPLGAWVLIALLIAGWTYSTASGASELVVTGRDGAVYLSIAADLASGGELKPQVVIPPFDIGPDLEFETPGWVLDGDGRLYQQFLHSVPATWAAYAGLLGDPAAVRWLNAPIGAIALFAFFGFSRRFLRPWTAVAATSTLAVSLPMIYFSRSTFTESAALALLLGGLWLSSVAMDQESSRSVLLGGFLLGLGCIVRVDGWLIGVALAAFVAVEHLSVEKESLLPRLWLGFLVGAAPGVIDLVVFSTPYLQLLRRQLLMVFVAILVGRLLVSGPGQALLRSATQFGRSVTKRPQPVVVALFFGFAAWVFVIRPLLTEAYGRSYGLETYEQLEGLVPGSGRNYNELAGWWPVWYLGVFLVVAAISTAAFGLANRHAWRDVGVRLTVAVLSVPTVLYLLVPSANPDHPWVMRRFLPAALPALVILGWTGVDRGLSRIQSSRWRVIGASVLVPLMLVPSWNTSRPLLGEIEGAGSLAMVEQMCDAVGSRPVLLVEEDEEMSTFFLPLFRVWCRVPVAAVDGHALAAALASIDAEILVVSAHPALIEAHGNPSPIVDTRLSFIQERLLSPPRDVRTVDVVLFGVTPATDLLPAAGSRSPIGDERATPVRGSDPLAGTYRRSTMPGVQPSLRQATDHE